jgi:diphthine synthase
MATAKLTFIGLGLFNERDLSLQGLEELRSCDKVFAEFYTSHLISLDLKQFEKLIGKKINILTREETESGKKIVQSALKEHVVFLTVGDPMTATTHIDTRLQAIQQGIPTQIIHNASIVTAAPGILGLQNYKFGRTTTLAFPEKDYFPTSPYTIIKNNKQLGLHTLVLLDIQANKDRYMTANEGISLLLQMEEKHKNRLFDRDTILCVVGRVGSPNPVVFAHTIEHLLPMDFGPPLHSLVVPGNLHFMEIEALELCAGLPKKVSKKIQKL